MLPGYNAYNHNPLLHISKMTSDVSVDNLIPQPSLLQNPNSNSNKTMNSLHSFNTGNNYVVNSSSVFFKKGDGRQEEGEEGLNGGGEKKEEFSEIRDSRSGEDYRNITFSGYRRTDARKELLLALINGKIESACYWSAEFICAGLFAELWELILLFVGKNIHLANVKIVFYLENRFQQFRQIIQQGNDDDDLSYRNSVKIRRMFAEIMAILASSPKKNSIEPVRVRPTIDFDIALIPDKLKADSLDYVQPPPNKEDPQEVFIPLNELAYNIHNKNAFDACYWIEWMVEFESICKKRKQPCKCERRLNYRVDHKFQKDIIWMVWDLLLATSVSNQSIHKIMNSILGLFCMKYTTGCAKKRRYLLYFAVSLLTDYVNWNLPIVAQKDVVQVAMMNIDGVYRQIKRGEQHSSSSSTDYSNDKSIYKMNMVSQLETTFGSV